VALGLYISVPFCRTKCSYCNFVSDVFSRAAFQRYVDRVGFDIVRARETAAQLETCFEPAVDSIYLGGGTPTVLDIRQLQQLFVTISQNSEILPDAEITVECAPGTLTDAVIAALRGCGVNRVSLGAQSFVDQEARAVGRLHTREIVLDDISRLRAAGIHNINVDLIAGLPHQTKESWQASISDALATGVPHVSVYMLEVDEDSRLGRELIAGGTKYHAHFVPDDDLIADLYVTACQQLESAGVRQYEISNFAKPGHESRHNLKYWTRQPYFGFGVDAHSMLLANGARNIAPAEPATRKAIRFSTPDSLEDYLSGSPLRKVFVTPGAALEEAFFLGLRLNRGVDLQSLASEFGADAASAFSPVIAELASEGLIEHYGEIIRLTPRGRLLSNEVFQRFLTEDVAVE
jgi:putative oxygen-independent coproporphyrinogen III oxidase